MLPEMETLGCYSNYSAPNKIQRSDRFVMPWAGLSVPKVPLD